MGRCAYGALRLWGGPARGARGPHRRPSESRRSMSVLRSSRAPHKAPRSGRRPMSERSDAPHKQRAQPFYGSFTNAARIQYETAAISADAGIVRIHAHTMRPANPQRTADSRFVAPTPTMEPVIVWVVLTGIP
jgi:hypothetical protein